MEIIESVYSDIYILNIDLIDKMMQGRITLPRPLSLKRQITILFRFINDCSQAFVEYNCFVIPVGNLPAQPMAFGFPGIVNYFSDQ